MAKEAKDKAKRDELQARMATAAMLRLEQCIVQVEAVMANAQWCRVPSMISDPLTAAITELREWKKACEAAIAGTLGTELPFDQKTLAQALNRVKKDLRHQVFVH